MHAASLVDRVVDAVDRVAFPDVAQAHCDIPCGIYDPHMAQVAALTVVRMVQLIQGLQKPDGSASKDEWDTYTMQISRYSATKEEHARLCEHEIVILWTDYFRPEHLEKHSNLHDLVWRASCSRTASNSSVSIANAGSMTRRGYGRRPLLQCFRSLAPNARSFLLAFGASDS